MRTYILLLVKLYFFLRGRGLLHTLGDDVEEWAIVACATLLLYHISEKLLFV
jgi:hypothetical protein